MARYRKQKKTTLDVFYDIAMRGAVILAVITAFLSMYPPSPIAYLFQSTDPNEQSKVVLYFALVAIGSLFVYGIIIKNIYDILKRQS
jgi:hypothetical protein